MTGGANTRAGGRRGWKWDERGHGDGRWGFAQRQQLGGLFGWEWGGEQSRAETLLRVDLDMARYPKAVCNDGSPGAYYVRKGVAWCNETDTMPLQCDHLAISRKRMSGGE